MEVEQSWKDRLWSWSWSWRRRARNVGPPTQASAFVSFVEVKESDKDQALRSAVVCQIQHEVRNANLGLLREWKQMLRTFPDTHTLVAQGATEEALKRLDELYSGVLAMFPFIKRIEEGLRAGVEAESGEEPRDVEP